MESLSKLITALSSLAWPMIFGFLLYKFHKPIQTLIESARGRKFTIKVAGNELTMEEASEQQRKIVNDVQSRLAEIEKRLEVSKTISLDREETKDAPRSKRILWIDDRPKNNSFLVASLQEMGHFVDIALSTRRYT